MAYFPGSSQTCSNEGMRGITFEELYSFPIDDANSVFEGAVVPEKFGNGGAFWTWRRNTFCFCFLGHVDILLMLLSCLFSAS